MTAKPTHDTRHAIARGVYWASWRIRHSRILQTMAVLALTSALGAIYRPAWYPWATLGVIVALSVYGAVWRRADCARWLRSIPTTGGLPVPLLWRTVRPAPTYGPRLFSVGSRAEDVVRGLLWVALLGTIVYYVRGIK